MSDQPLTLAVLAEFHREVILPDTRRLVREAIQESERRLVTKIDGLAHRIEGLATELALTNLAVKRIEERLGAVEVQVALLGNQFGDLVSAMRALEERVARVEARLEEIASDGERAAVRAEVERLRVRVEALHDEIRRIERRIASSEEQ